METQALVNDEGIKEQFFSLEDAAQQLGVSRKGLDDYLSKHPDLKASYLTKAHLNGRRRFVLDVRALPFIAMTRNTNSKNLEVQGISKMKEAVASKVVNDLTLEARIKALEDRLTGRTKINPRALPMATEKAAPISLRSLVNQRIRTFAEENEVDYYVPWGRLYEEMYYRYHVNLRKQAKSRNIKPLEVLEQDNLLNEAWKLSCELFPLSSDTNSLI